MSVSVIIPAYNAERFIGGAVSSCWRQTLRPEVVVVDDGSTDMTAEIAATLGARLIPLGRNYGAAHALNVGIESAESKYVSILAADDRFIPEDKLQRQVEAMELEGADLSYYRMLRKAGRTHDYFTSDWPLLLALYVRNPINGSSVMLRRDGFDRYGWFDAELRNQDPDGDLWIRWVKGGARVVQLDGAGTFYNVHGGQSSKKRLAWYAAMAKVRLRNLA